MARLLRDGVAPGADDFRDQVLDAHRRLTAAYDDGRWRLPWPRALGTPPWAVRRGLAAVTGRPHRVRLARLPRTTRAAAYDRLAVRGGALYVGSPLLPRHVLLVLAPEPGDAGLADPTGHALRCYQPSRGTVVRLAREDFVAGRLREAGWPRPWFAVSP
jgi:hypothetical protein